MFVLRFAYSFFIYYFRYLDHKQWDDAERVAEQIKEDGLVEEVLTARAAEEFSLQNYSRFEALCLRARKPETIVNMYKVTE